MGIAGTAARRGLVAAKNAVFLNALDRLGADFAMEDAVFFAELLRRKQFNAFTPQPALFVDGGAPVLVGRGRHCGHVFFFVS
jgi:hypothetical protein